MGLSTAATDKNECQKSNVAGGRHFENRLVAISLRRSAIFDEIIARRCTLVPEGPDVQLKF